MRRRQLGQLRTPEATGALLVELALDNNLARAPLPVGPQQLNVRLKQHVEAGASGLATGGQAPVVMVHFSAEVFEGADEKGGSPSKNLVTAKALFRVNFRATGQSREELLAYTSSAEVRNIALQATAICQRLFRDQLRLTGLPYEAMRFPELGEFGALAKNVIDTQSYADVQKSSGDKKTDAKRQRRKTKVAPTS